MSAIDACDFASAIGRLGCTAAQSEDGVIAALTEKFHTEIQSLQELMESAPTVAIAGITKRIADIEAKIRNIACRVNESDCCPIGLDDIVIKALTPCCQNAFEFSNLIKALERAGRCPLCKHALTAGQVVVCHKDGPPTPANDGASSSAVKKITSKRHALEMIVDRIFVGNDTAKVLVFSEWDMHMTEDVLRSKGISHRQVKGNTSVVNDTIRRFNEGLLPVMLLNTHHFGAGLNLQAATHVITLHKMADDKYTQLIGRAQRPVRSTQLDVINIRFHDE
jgi:hypothetical protein